MGNFICGAEKIKPFLNVHYKHCTVSHQKRVSKMSTLPPL